MGQGLPAAVLGTLPTTDARTALCYLTPAPRTTWHRESGPSYYSLGISVQDQLLPPSLGIHFRISVASGFAPAEPPTMAQPWHQLSLGSLHCQHTTTGTSSAMPCIKLSLELPRRTGSGMTGASLQCIKDKIAPSTMLP